MAETKPAANQTPAKTGNAAPATAKPSQPATGTPAPATSAPATPAATEPKETKAETLKRLFASRMEKAATYIRLLGNLGSANYGATKEQREKMAAYLQTEVDKTKQRILSPTTEEEDVNFTL